jgi:thiol-disulfide isomerase/thioredoxin
MLFAKKFSRTIFVSLLLLLTFPALSAEDYKFKGLDGSIVKLSDFKGKWVVVNYWATWCPTCLKEMPELNSFHEENENAVVLGVNYESIAPKLAQQFLDDHMIEFPNVQEINGPNGRTTSFGPLKGLPTTYMINPSGEVVATRVGLVDQKLLESFIKKYESMAKK